ncbi:hypothetical protein XH99_13985 [Bradyrhizobium nanningense]|uniref:Uncharacterized protein n=1 Tax=Bradyrhizobium nanningense TaxID=1325118 RepID=A0A4Q0S4R2_9BRAD|nr:hypothetical protein XH99_13985 [Bradyrhizobium nanningense]
MAVMDRFGAIWFQNRVKSEDHVDHLAPIGPFFFGHQQPDINCKMFFVVGVYAIGFWRPQGRKLVDRSSTRHPAHVRISTMRPRTLRISGEVPRVDATPSVALSFPGRSGYGHSSPWRESERKPGDTKAHTAGYEARYDAAKHAAVWKAQMPIVRPTKRGSAKAESRNTSQQNKPMTRIMSGGPSHLERKFVTLVDRSNL